MQDWRLPLVIVNPASRGGAGGRDWPSAASTLATHFGAFECRFTESTGHAVEIARNEAKAGRQLLMTFGGDGTISETARGILGSGAPCELSVLPHGTGGDFIRSLASPARLADTARGLRRGRTVRIDVGPRPFSPTVARGASSIPPRSGLAPRSRGASTTSRKAARAT